MARGKKREKRPNYVGSKGDLAKQQEEWNRIHPNKKKKTVYFEDAPLLMFAVLFLWCVFFVFDFYAYNNLALMLPVTVIGLCLIALLHLSGPKRWLKSRRSRRTAFYVLFCLIIAAITMLVFLCRNGIFIPIIQTE